LPVAPIYGSISASTSEPRGAFPCHLDGEGDRRPLDPDHLADQSGEIRDGTAELPGEQAEQRTLLFVGRSVVDEDDGGPRLRFEDVLRDVGRDRDRQTVDGDAFDRALVDAPGDRRVAGLVVGVLADPARAEDIARADFQQATFDLVAHRVSLAMAVVGRVICRGLSSIRSTDRCRSNDRTILRRRRCQE
jgi:hypothetical protein